MKQPYNTALYMRLSQDDRNFGDSVSIETQRTILQTYARDNGLLVVDEYVDDGWSGTNFDRPALGQIGDFQRRSIPFNDFHQVYVVEQEVSALS